MSKRVLTDEEKAQKIRDSFDALETQRTEGVERTQRIQQTKQTALSRERARLVQKYGEQHPRVTKIDRQLKTNPELFKAFREETVRSKVNPPDPPATAWSVYGTVRDKDNNRLSGLTLSLFDEERRWIQELGYVCTDERGFYNLSIEDPNGKLEDKYKERPLCLTVTNDDRSILHKEEKPLFFTRGRTENREIILKNGGTCTPPEEEERPDIGLILDGRVVTSRNQPAPGLTVQAFDQGPERESRLGQSTTGENGNYSIVYRKEDYLKEGEADRGANVFLLVHDADGQQMHRTDVYPDVPGKQTINIRLEQQEEETRVLDGKVSDTNGNPLGGVRIQAFDVFRDEQKQLNGEAKTNDDGYYRLQYKKSDFLEEDEPDRGANVVLYAYDATGNLLHKSEVYENVAPEKTIDLRIRIAEENYLLDGRVLSPNGAPLSKHTVQVFDVGAGEERKLGDETLTDENGYYKLPYRKEDFIKSGERTRNADMVINIYNPRRRLIHKSEVYRNVPPTKTIDIVVEG